MGTMFRAFTLQAGKMPGSSPAPTCKPLLVWNKIMTNKKMDGVQIWKQFEDLLIPGLRLSVIERAVYSHLLRHSRLEGKPRVRFSIPGLTRVAGLSRWMIRKGLRRLLAKGALRLAEKGKWGHTIEVRLPEEVRAVRSGKIAPRNTRLRPIMANPNLEEADFLATPALRQSIHAREGGRCFYCLRRSTPATRCLDHVVPRAWMGSNSYRNLVSSCSECNSLKGERRAQDFLRWLYREGRLESGELKERLLALEKMASGKMRPKVDEGT
jgi:5-methylcytosine-specific restriction endonuclease McrA